MQKTTLQHLMGYFLGGLIVLIVIPHGIFFLSKYLDHLVNIQLLPFSTIRYVISVILMVCGLIFALWSIIIQNIIGKGGPLEVANIEISPKTRNLVVSGPYNYTRNPMLFGTFMAYFAFAIYLNSITAVLIVCLHLLRLC